jgi:hypothetical protein
MDVCWPEKKAGDNLTVIATCWPEKKAGDNLTVIATLATSINPGS